MGTPRSCEIILFGARGKVKIFRLSAIRSYTSVQIQVLATIPSAVTGEGAAIEDRPGFGIILDQRACHADGARTNHGHQQVA